MADADGERAVAPTASDGMDIRATDAATFNFDVDITVLKFLWFELGIGSAMYGHQVDLSMAAYFLLLKVAPLALVLDHETLKCVWVRHLGLVLIMRLK